MVKLKKKSDRKNRNIFLAFLGTFVLCLVFCGMLLFFLSRTVFDRGKEFREQIQILLRSVSLEDEKAYLLQDGKMFDQKEEIQTLSYPMHGRITVNQGNVFYQLEDGDYCVEKLDERETIHVGSCSFLPNEPVIPTNMIPVKYDEDRGVFVSVDPEKETWYDYAKQEWANVIAIDYEKVKSKYFTESGNLISGRYVDMEEDVLMMYVWIPRFKYAVPSGDGPREVSVQFELETERTGNNKKEVRVSKIDQLKNSDYYTHPAFTFGEEELKGFWVSKFELGDNDQDMTNNKDALILSKPDRYSLTNLNFSTMWTLTRMTVHNETDVPNRYGMIHDVDAHLIKNMDWGAVALFSSSKYGKYGNPQYSGKEKEIFLNNSYAYGYYGPSITGCSSGMTEADVYVGCQYRYQLPYYGTGASTTGNVSGIYDMNGGAWEEVMGNYQRYVGLVDIHSSGFNGKYGRGDEDRFEGIPFPDDKYFDEYEEENNGKKGDATNLDGTKNWYDDYSTFPNYKFPWYVRGGVSQIAKYSGIYAYISGCGSEMDGVTSRIVLTNRGDVS